MTRLRPKVTPRERRIHDRLSILVELNRARIRNSTMQMARLERELSISDAAAYDMLRLRRNDETDLPHDP